VTVVTKLKPDDLPPAFVQAPSRACAAPWTRVELGYPVMHVKATIIGAEMDEELSNDVAFPGGRGRRRPEGMRGNMILLEPWMKIQVQVPDTHGGQIIADVNARRGEGAEVRREAATRRRPRSRRTRHWPTCSTTRTRCAA